MPPEGPIGYQGGVISDLAKKYDLRVPRYTSYPTSPHFEAVETDAAYRGWLSELEGSERPSLYVHIPFCDEMCWFCGCYTKIVKRHEPVGAYLESVVAEVDLVADAIGHRLSAQHLHFGGGSPTMLTPDEFAKVIGKVGDRFRIDGASEVAVELDPRTATQEYVEGLARAGVNRASIGVQDFHPKVQEAIHRIQPFEMTRDVVGWLRGAGIERLNMDLMYGLPFQTTELVVDMVDKAVSLHPRRFALFGYAHVPWMKSHQKMIPEEHLPDIQARWEQFDAAAERLAHHGYLPIGLDHYALPEDELAVALSERRLRRNFQGYTTDAAQLLIGLGASSIGHLSQGFIQNTLPIHTYADQVAAGRLPVAKMRPFQDDDVLRGTLIERLMCNLELDVDAVCAELGADPSPFDPALSELAALQSDGLLVVEGRRIAMTEAGRPLVRLAASVFDAYLKKGQERHSKAV